MVVWELDTWSYEQYKDDPHYSCWAYMPAHGRGVWPLWHGNLELRYKEYLNTNQYDKSNLAPCGVCGCENDHCDDCGEWCATWGDKYVPMCWRCYHKDCQDQTFAGER